MALETQQQPVTPEQILNLVTHPTLTETTNRLVHEQSFNEFRDSAGLYVERKASMGDDQLTIAIGLGFITVSAIVAKGYRDEEQIEMQLCVSDLATTDPLIGIPEDRQQAVLTSLYEYLRLAENFPTTPDRFFDIREIEAMASILSAIKGEQVISENPYPMTTILETLREMTEERRLELGFLPTLQEGFQNIPISVEDNVINGEQTDDTVSLEVARVNHLCQKYFFRFNMAGTRELHGIIPGPGTANTSDFEVSFTYDSSSGELVFRSDEYGRYITIQDISEFRGFSVAAAEFLTAEELAENTDRRLELITEMHTQALALRTKS